MFCSHIVFQITFFCRACQTLGLVSDVDLLYKETNHELDAPKSSHLQNFPNFSRTVEKHDKVLPISYIFT